MAPWVRAAPAEPARYSGRGPRVRTFLAATAVAVGLFALLPALLLVFPAPRPGLALIAVAASEWSLWWVLLGLVAVGSGTLATVAGGPWMAWLGVAFGSGAVLAGLVPPLQAWPVARANGVQLDPLRTLTSWNRTSGDAPRTVTFATVDGQTLQADVTLSHASSGPLSPAIVVVHGGSWRTGDKGALPQWSDWLAGQGYAVFDIQYRLSPQPNWRTATGDVKCAVGWVKQHAGEFGVDPDRVALLGRSAGGHLALLAAYTPRDPALAPSCDVPDGSDSVRAAISFYGPTDLAWGYQHPVRFSVLDGPATLRAFLGGDPRALPAAYATASPITHVGPTTPPTLLLHGGRDQLVGPGETQRLAARLQAAGAPQRTVLLPYAHHGFDYVFDGWGAQIAQAVVLDFLRQHLGPAEGAAR